MNSVQESESPCESGCRRRRQEQTDGAGGREEHGRTALTAADERSRSGRLDEHMRTRSMHKPDWAHLFYL